MTAALLASRDCCTVRAAGERLRGPRRAGPRGPVARQDRPQLPSMQRPSRRRPSPPATAHRRADRSSGARSRHNKHGRSWVHVRLPGRPNSGSGWITTDGTMPSWTPWRLSVNLNARLLTVYYRGRVSAAFRPSSASRPRRRHRASFFIEEGLWLGPGPRAAPTRWPPATDRTSYTEFDGGPGQIAIHGMDNLPGALGTASSHGCIRLDAPDDHLARDTHRCRRATEILP